MNCTYHRYCHADAVTLAHTPAGMRHALCSRHLATRLRRRPDTPTDDSFSGLGVVYLLHFDTPLSGHARHYLGWTTNLPQRLHDHAAGNGARIMAAVSAAGISWSVVRTWKGSRSMESRFKRHAHLDRLCPHCRPRSREERRIKRVGERRYGAGYQAPNECGHRKLNKACRRCRDKGELSSVT